MTEAERRAALDAVAREVRACTRCRLHEGRTQAVPGEGHPSTEVVFVGEGPGVNEDRQGRPFVGRAGDLLVRLLATIGWRREEVFITNVVKCRPPDNRDPEADEIAACAPYLRRQLETLDPALVVTLGRHSLGRFMPGARIGQVHGTHRPVDPGTGARAAIGYALYHPAAALRSAEVERQSYGDVLGIPAALLASRAMRDPAASAVAAPVLPAAVTPAAVTPAAGTPAAGTPAAGTPAAGTPPPTSEILAPRLADASAGPDGPVASVGTAPVAELPHGATLAVRDRALDGAPQPAGQQAPPSLSLPPASEQARASSGAHVAAVGTESGTAPVAPPTTVGPATTVAPPTTVGPATTVAPATDRIDQLTTF
jgi:DNA polymerase